jgi:hypothetical protein
MISVNALPIGICVVPFIACIWSGSHASTSRKKYGLLGSKSFALPNVPQADAHKSG